MSDWSVVEFFFAKLALGLIVTGIFVSLLAYVRELYLRRVHRPSERLKARVRRYEADELRRREVSG